MLSPVLFDGNRNRFSQKNKLNFLSKKHLIKIDNETDSHLKHVGAYLLFTLIKNEVFFKQNLKQIESIVSIKEDQTLFVDAEDFDLWI